MGTVEDMAPPVDFTTWTFGGAMPSAAATREEA